MGGAVRGAEIQGTLKTEENMYMCRKENVYVCVCVCVCITHTYINLHIYILTYVYVYFPSSPQESLMQQRR